MYTRLVLRRFNAIISDTTEVQKCPWFLFGPAYLVVSGRYLLPRSLLTRPASAHQPRTLRVLRIGRFLALNAMSSFSLPSAEREDASLPISTYTWQGRTQPGIWAPASFLDRLIVLAQYETSLNSRMLAQRCNHCLGKSTYCVACGRLDNSASRGQEWYGGLGPVSEILLWRSSFGEQLCICWKICALGNSPKPCHDAAAPLLIPSA